MRMFNLTKVREKRQTDGAALKWGDTGFVNTYFFLLSYLWHSKGDNKNKYLGQVITGIVEIKYITAAMVGKNFIKFKSTNAHDKSRRQTKEVPQLP